MLLALALGIGAQDAPAAGEPPITVIARKLGEWRGSFRARGGKLECHTRRPSGDAAVDEIACASLMACVPQFEPRIVAAANRKLPADTRKQMNADVNRDLVACLGPERERRIAALADARAAAQQE